MDYVQVIFYRITLLLFLIIPVSAQSASVIQFPKFIGFTPPFAPVPGFGSIPTEGFGNHFQVKPSNNPIDPNPVRNWGVKNGYVWQSPAKGSLSAVSRMSALDAQKMSIAITGVGKVSQPLAKVLAMQVIRFSTGMLLAGVVVDMGLKYIDGDWVKTDVLSNQVLIGGVAYTSYGNCSAPGYGTGVCIYTSGTPIPPGAHSYCSGYFAQGYTCGGLVSNLPVGPGEVSIYTGIIGTVTVNKAVDWSLYPTRNLTDFELEEMVRLGFAVPVEQPVATVVIANGNDLSHLSAAALADLLNMGYFTDSQLTVNAGAPHKDPVTGQDVQPKLAVEAAPNGGIRVTSYDQPINTDGTPATNPDGTPKPAEESKDPCAANPDSVTCSSLGSLDPSADPVPTTLNVSLTPGTLSTAGSCPAPRSLTLAGHAVVMSFQPICDASSTYIRPFVLLASAVVSTFIFVGGLKS